jgi:hypothetical protein
LVLAVVVFDHYCGRIVRDIFLAHTINFSFR